MAKFIAGLFFGMCLGGFLVAMNRDLFSDIKCGNGHLFRAGDAENCSNY